MRASQYCVSQFNLKCIKYYQEPCSTFRKGKKIMLVPTLHPDRISSLFLSRAVPRAACTLHGSHGDHQQSLQGNMATSLPSPFLATSARCWLFIPLLATIALLAKGTHSWLLVCLLATIGLLGHRDTLLAPVHPVGTRWTQVLSLQSSEFGMTRALCVALLWRAAGCSNPAVLSASAGCPQQDPHARNKPSNPTHTSAYRRAEPCPTLTNKIWSSAPIRVIPNTSGRGIPSAATAARQTEPNAVQGHTAPSAESCLVGIQLQTQLGHSNPPAI